MSGKRNNGIQQGEKSNIALIGYRCSGKSTVGKVLADRLHRRFIEVDDIIVSYARKPLKELYQKDGEIKFRELEIRAIKKASSAKGAVISCGGGTVLNKINIDRLRESCSIVLLTASENVLKERARLDYLHERPPLTEKGVEQSIHQVMLLRGHLYNTYADFSVDTTGLDVEGVVNRIADEVLGNDGHDRKG